MSSCRGWSSLGFLTVALLVVGPVGILAQTSNAVCLPWFGWMDNSDNQNPCLVSAYLQGACNDGQFTVYALPNGTHYTGPYANQQNPCQCSSVTYNTVSACGLCQNHTIISWSAWNFNCSTVYPGVFPPGVPDGTAVPQWAFQDVTTSDLFNVTLAQSVGDDPESTAIHAQSTGCSLVATLSGASASLTATPSASSQSNSGINSNTGAIAGGVVGGVVGVALIAAVAIFFLMKKKRSQIPPSAQYGAGLATPPSTNYSDVFSSQMVQHKLYDPYDPSTFPASLPPSAGLADNITNSPAANHSTPSVQPSGRYSGVPEI